MLPSHLLVGVAAGLLMRPWRDAAVLLASGAVIAVLFGAVVGASTGSPATFAGGTALAMANLSVGVAAGWIVRLVGSAVAQVLHRG